LLLRSEAHYELAKIEEDIEQLDAAKTNLLKVEIFYFDLLNKILLIGETIR
jgi:hypothetical protein